MSDPNQTLDSTMQEYAALGYRVVSRGVGYVQMVKPKSSPWYAVLAVFVVSSIIAGVALASKNTLAAYVLSGAGSTIVLALVVEFMMRCDAGALIYADDGVEIKVFKN